MEIDINYEKKKEQNQAYKSNKKEHCQVYLLEMLDVCFHGLGNIYRLVVMSKSFQ